MSHNRRITKQNWPDLESPDDPVMLGDFRSGGSKRGTGRLQRLRRRRRRIVWLLVLGLALALPLGLAGWAFLVEPRILTVTRVSLVLDDLPETWHGRVVAFFSDTHLGPAYPPDRLDRVTAAINQAKPDLIIFGGDLIDHRTPDDPEFRARCGQSLAAMQAPLGKYAVAGNHDNRLRAVYRNMQDILNTGGFTLLDNQSVIIEDLWLGGLAESYFSQPDPVRTFSAAGLISTDADGTGLTGREPGDLFRLLVLHQPDAAAALSPETASLMLSGHSHNGQVTVLGRPLVTVYGGERFTYGTYPLQGHGWLIVSRGLGTTGLPVRFGAPPELVLITLLCR